MPGVTPESALHHAAGIGRIDLETRELPVADGFKQKAKDHKGATHKVKVAQRGGAGGGDQ